MKFFISVVNLLYGCTHTCEFPNKPSLTELGVPVESTYGFFMHTTGLFATEVVPTIVEFRSIGLLPKQSETLHLKRYQCMGFRA